VAILPLSRLQGLRDEKLFELTSTRFVDNLSSRR